MSIEPFTGFPKKTISEDDRKKLLEYLLENKEWLAKLRSYLNIPSGGGAASVTPSTPSSGLTDGDYGDITVGGSGTTMTIDNDVVSYAKIQNVVNNNRILGRISGANGDVEELTAANTKTLLGYPTSTTDNTVPRFDSTAGNMQTSSLVVADDGAVTVDMDANGVISLSNFGGLPFIGLYNDEGDANTSINFIGAGINLGAGGASATDVALSRTAANVLTLASGDDLRLVSAGTDTTSVTRNTGSQTLTDKDISSTTNTYRAASTTVVGAAELATTAETDTGTDTTRVVTPDGLSGSVYGTKVASIYVIDAATTVTTGDGKAYLRIPTSLNGMDLVSCGASVITTSSSGNPTVQLARGRQANATTAHAFTDMLSTKLTIDATEYDSKDATAFAIDTSNDDVLTGDLIRVDVDVAGTGTKGLIVTLSFRTP